MDLVEYLSSEGWLHDDTEQDLSNPIYVDYLYSPHTLTTTEVSSINDNYYSIVSYTSSRHSIIR